MGIVNLTPDSFSDGGRFTTVEAAVEAALELVSQGAAILDLGPESTRPGAQPVSAEEECRRLLPVLEALRARTDAVLSVDTRRSSTARAALERGADAINDVSLLRHDPAIASEAARAGATLVLSHSSGAPDTLHGPVTGSDIVAVVRAELELARARALEAGCTAERIVLDPGLGFGKTTEDNLDLLRRLPELKQLGSRLLVGASRKRFIGALLSAEGRERPTERRDGGSVGVALAAVIGGATILRVHDVGLTHDALLGFLGTLPTGAAA